MEQARKMKEVTVLLMQAKQAREEALNTISGKVISWRTLETYLCDYRGCCMKK